MPEVVFIPFKLIDRGNEVATLPMPGMLSVLLPAVVPVVFTLLLPDEPDVPEALLLETPPVFAFEPPCGPTKALLGIPVKDAIPRSQYLGVRCVPGSVMFNEMPFISDQCLMTMADSVYSVGSIQSGCDVSPSYALPMVPRWEFRHILSSRGMFDIFPALALKLK